MAKDVAYHSGEDAIAPAPPSPADNIKPAQDPARQRRRRRTREEVAERIRTAARQLFAERGYAAATTREIARVADVSETLLFRYHGGKAALFEEVVSAPFVRLMQEFVFQRADPSHPTDRIEDSRRFVTHVFELFEGNRQMFSAILAARPTWGEEQAALPSQGLDSFFDQAVEQLNIQYAVRGQKPTIDLAIGVRLGFGMIAASVLLRDWLFPVAPPSSRAITDVLQHMVEHALDPPPDIDRAGPETL